MKHYKIIITNILFFLGYSLSICGQDIVLKNENKSISTLEGPHSQIIPSSPQSQIFEKYVNHQITEYNGLPEINIPLYTIEIKGMKIPISLTYHASGIKYKQYDGDIGAGWSINAGGYRVSRTIYGKPDEEFDFCDLEMLKYNLLGAGATSAHKRDSLMASVGLTMAEASQIEPSVTRYLKDGEHDQFVYMLPSTSGHFLITDRPRKLVTVLGENQDRVILNETGSSVAINDINITDTEGFRYLLGRSDLSPNTHENVYDASARGYVTGSWLLSRIESPYQDTITFKYNNHYVKTTRALSKTYSLLDAEEHNPNNYPLYQDPRLTTVNSYQVNNQYDTGHTSSNISLISSIETDQVVVSFTRTSHRLNQIIVRNKVTGMYMKRILFQYHTSPANADISSDALPWHQLLTSVTIYNGWSSADKKYGFTYYPGPDTPENAYPDQWGYYHTNFQATSASMSMYQDMFLHNEFGEDKVVDRISRSANSKLKFKQVAPTVPFANRSDNQEIPNYFSLKRIQYPTGGDNVYEYENNRFGNGIQGGGLRIKRIIPSISTRVISEYSYGENDNGNGVLSGSMSDLKSCFADEYYYFSALFELPMGQKNNNRLGTRQAIKVYGTLPLDKDAELYMKVSYKQVTCQQYDPTTQTYLGRIVSKYNIPTEYEMGYSNNYPNINMNDRIFHVQNYTGYGKNYIKTYRLGQSPELIGRIVYNKDSVVVQKEQWQYATLKEATWEGLKIKQKVFFEYYPGYLEDLRNCEHYQSISSIFDPGFYNIEFKQRKPSLYNIWNFDLNGGNPVFTSTGYQYDLNGLLVEMTTKNSLYSQKEEWYTYPSSDTELYRKNMLQTLIGKCIRNNDLETERIVYQYPDDSIWMSGIQHISGIDGKFRTECTYDAYDKHGNLLQYTRSDGTKVAYIWSYNYQYPVAEILNASLDEIYSYLSKMDIESLAKMKNPSEEEWSLLKLLRNQLKKAQVTIYKYEPSIGMTEKNDPSGFTTCYYYGPSGVLARSTFKEGNIERLIESHTYNYLYH